MAQSSITTLIEGEELYAFKKNGCDIVAHFHEGKMTM